MYIHVCVYIYTERVDNTVVLFHACSPPTCYRAENKYFAGPSMGQNIPRVVSRSSVTAGGLAGFRNVRVPCQYIYHKATVAGVMYQLCEENHPKSHEITIQSPLHLITSPFEICMKSH